VFIHKLICQDTLEERILELQKTKAALVEGLLAGRTEGPQLTADDLRRLIEPVASED
jgi:SNF2 family DNA or RNA helicase